MADAWNSMGRPWRGGARARPHSGHSAARSDRFVWQLGQVRRVGVAMALYLSGTSGLQRTTSGKEA